MASFPVAHFVRATSDLLSNSVNAAVYSPTPPFYVCCFLKLESLAANMVVLGSLDAWVVSASANQIGFAVSNTSPAVIAVTPITIQAGSWYFVEAWNDGSVLHLCVTKCDQFDFASESTISFTGTMMVSSGPFILGQIQQGSIHSACILNAIPSYDDRRELYNLGTAMPYPLLSPSITGHLVGFWELNELSGNRLDSTSNHFNLVPSGAVGTTTRPINGQVNDVSPTALDRAIYKRYLKRRLDKVFVSIFDDGGMDSDVFNEDTGYPTIVYRTTQVTREHRTNYSESNSHMLSFFIRHTDKDLVAPLADEVVRCFQNCKEVCDDGSQIVIGLLTAPPLLQRESTEVWSAAISFGLIHRAVVETNLAFGG